MDHALCASKAVIVRDGKILVIKQAFDWGEFYDLPGGRIVKGRTPEEHLKIEIKEEVGLEAEVGRLLGYSWFIRDTDGNQVVCLLFECKVKSYDVDITRNPAEEENITEYMWVAPEEFPKLDEKSLFLRTTSEALNDFFRVIKR
jgi:8-oxo-dGTP pyrophosphatase MutT (NUDIX family)